MRRPTLQNENPLIRPQQSQGTRTDWVIVLLIITLLISASLIVGFEACAQEQPDVALWLARSCVGEAGWNTAESGECVAIAHIYLKRVRINRKSYYWNLRRYSAAVRKGHGKIWVMALRRDGKRPSGFRKLEWSRHRSYWLKTLLVADQFIAGETEDPLPTALHYGGYVDRHRLNPKAWRRIPVEAFRNRFYERRR